MATAIVGAVVLGIAILAGRSVYKNHKNGSCASCGGNCAGCQGCHGGKQIESKKER